MDTKLIRNILVNAPSLIVLFLILNSCNRQYEPASSETILHAELAPLDSLISDIQNNIYPVMQFQNQRWTASNYMQTRFNNGDDIPEAKNQQDWLRAAQHKSPAWCYLHYDSSKKMLYGVYYNWYALKDPRGLTPQGWEICPNKQAYILARDHEFEAHPLKDASHWKDSTYRKNQTGFSARPGGYVAENGSFFDVGSLAFFWTATQKNEHRAMYFELSDGFNQIHFSDLSKGVGMNVRLFRKLNPNE